jgi:hypothetical protein
MVIRSGTLIPYVSLIVTRQCIGGSQLCVENVNLNPELRLRLRLYPNLSSAYLLSTVKFQGLQVQNRLLYTYSTWFIKASYAIVL